MMCSLILLAVFLTKVDFKNQSDILLTRNQSCVVQEMLNFFQDLPQKAIYNLIQKFYFPLGSWC